MLEGGEIVERGTHDELLARDGRYRQLYDKQYKLETNRFINPGEDFTPEAPKPVALKPAVDADVNADATSDCGLASYAIADRELPAEPSAAFRQYFVLVARDDRRAEQS